MRGPYEPYGDGRVAFIVDLQATMVHQPRPGALDHPASRERLELVRMDPVDDLDGDVMVPAVVMERVLNPASHHS